MVIMGNLYLKRMISGYSTFSLVPSILLFYTLLQFTTALLLHCNHDSQKSQRYFLYFVSQRGIKFNFKLYFTDQEVDFNVYVLIS